LKEKAIDIDEKITGAEQTIEHGFTRISVWLTKSQNFTRLPDKTRSAVIVNDD
jgi:hypothetical protein